jgi:alkanesulfonate monooxygenase SsuD/methylene tetrahydromethanopterin reductase-like flavin-dependent oxidoreductase (luciferase family)
MHVGLVMESGRRKRRSPRRCPSIASVPLVLVAAIAARTTRVRIGTGVSVLPLCHPIRTAEEAATVDQLSHGRLDFGVGRSGFPRAYSGYGVRYDESRERFQESLDVILKAWTQEGFSRAGTYFTFDNLTVVPRPYQKPHPPIFVAATTHDTFPMVGRMGLSLVTGLRGFDVPEAVTYEDVLRDRVAYGTPDMVVDRLRWLRDELGLSGVIMESNVGGRIALDRVLASIRLYAEEVAPRLR